MTGGCIDTAERIVRRAYRRTRIARIVGWLLPKGGI